MEISPLAWVVLPLLGGVIGYGTNLLAVKMIFRPIRPVRILGFSVQGLVGRRQAEIARSIGGVVGDHLVNHKDLVAALEGADLAGMLNRVLEDRLPEVLASVKKSLGPMAGLLDAFLTPERVTDLRGKLVTKILENREVLVEQLEQALEQGLDVKELVERKVAQFPVERLEALILQVARRELRSIEVLGGVLGWLIGIAQTALLAVL
ncbi:MAG: DUF445 family protein [Planctomycetes bacterium]|nr:DUF445 family protein [Planctomycetota bacterium]MCB9911099.1 DUF445 family protein [Planctomycetota bacterium]